MAVDDARIVREFIERVWNDGELDAIDELLASNYTIHSDPGDPWEGRTLDRPGFRERLVESRAPFPDLRFEVDECVAAPGRVVLAWTLTGTHRGELSGLPASGHRIRVKGVTVYHVERGRITGHRQVVDRLGVLQQIGGRPAAG